MPKLSLADRAANTIRGLILKNELQPGVHINIDSLSKRLEISQTPIREALKKLIAEGLATYTPKVGYSVRNLSLHEYLQVSEIHQALEVHLVRELTKIPFLVDFDWLEAINDALAAHIEAGDMEMIAEKNDIFHLGLYKSYPNQLLVARLAEFCNEVRTPRNNMFKSMLFTKKIHAEHVAILDGIRSEDPDSASSAMLAHYASAKESAIVTFPISNQ